MSNRSINGAGGALRNHTVLQQRRLIMWLACLDEVVAAYTGRAMTGITISKKEDGWLLVLRGKNGSGHEVAFASGPDLHGTVLDLAAQMKAGSIRWKPDKYA